MNNRPHLWTACAAAALAALLIFASHGSGLNAAAEKARKLPPVRTPKKLMRATPPIEVAAKQIERFKKIMPKAFYSKDVLEHNPSTLEILAKDEYEKEQGYRFDKIIRGDTSNHEITLTFDDGPHPKYTLELLAVLQRLKVPATFFLVGKQVVKFPDLVKAEVMAGYEVGDHTYDHVNLTEIPPHLIGYELDRCDLAIKNITGSSVRFFRPPGGDYDGDVIHEAAKRDYVTTLWTDDPGDYADPGSAVILKRTLDNLEDGAIVLLHDGVQETVDILPQLITEARNRGYVFVSLTQLAHDREDDR